MSDKKNDIKTVDCTRSCRMTSTLRDSQYCTGEAKIINGKVFFGCQEKLKSEPKEVRAFYDCQLWNLGQHDSCYTCPLDCISNKNENMKNIKEEREQLEALIEQLRPNMMLWGVDASQIEKIRSVYSNPDIDEDKNEAGREAVNAAAIANEALQLAMSGKMVDLAFLNMFARSSSRRLSKFASKKKIKFKK